MKSKKSLLEGHKEVVNMVVRCRIKIEDREDPTVLDIMTDMRALPGVVTVRQTRPVSDIISNYGHRIIELNVSFIAKFLDKSKRSNASREVLKSLKIIEGVSMVKLVEHDDPRITDRISISPIIY